MFDNLKEKADKIDMEEGYAVVEGEPVMIRNTFTICNVCGKLLSNNPTDFEVMEETCERGCCHEGWSTSIKNWKFVVNGEFWCIDCYNDRKNILQQRIYDHFDKIDNSLDGQIKELKKKLERLKCELNERQEAQNAFNKLKSECNESTFTKAHINILENIGDYYIARLLDVYKPLALGYEIEENGQYKIVF